MCFLAVKIQKQKWLWLHFYTFCLLSSSKGGGGNEGERLVDCKVERVLANIALTNITNWWSSSLDTIVVEFFTDFFYSLCFFIQYYFHFQVVLHGTHIKCYIYAAEELLYRDASFQQHSNIVTTTTE